MRKMKDSGVEWIGEIPDNWEMRRLKYTLKERKEKNNPIITNFILSLSMERGVFPYSEKVGGGNKAKADLTAYKVAYPNDIVLNSMNILSGSVGLSKWLGAVSPVYYTYYSDNEDFNVNFYHYLFHSKEFQRSLLGLGNGILMKESNNGKLNTIRMRIPSEKLNRLLFPIPPKSEQLAIVDFLDEKVAKIDAIIADTKQSIEELKLYKQSVISEAVTKGIENRPLVSSGIDWMGDIPERWKINRSKNILKFNKGLSITKENLTDSGIPVISYGQVHSKYPVKFDPNQDVLPFVPKSYQKIENAQLKKGDFVFADTSEDLAGSGNFSMLTSNAQVMAGYHSIVVRIKPKLKDLDPTYLSYYFASDMHRNQVRINVSGIKVFSITQAILKNTLILIPDYETQLSIAAFLENQTCMIDSLIDDKEKLIAKYGIYKKSMIYEYVTGKKQVI